MTHASMTPSERPYSSTTGLDENEMRSGSYVDWSCALGGAAIAAATTSLLLSFGSGLGLTMLSPWPSERMNGTLFGIIMIIWAVFVPLLSFALGGYFAGRMRRPWQNLVTDEVAFRDGAHGALVWAAGLLMGAILLGMLASGAANLVTSGMTAAADVSTGPTMSRMVDDLFRSERPMDDATKNMREEAQRMVGTSAVVTLSQPDQTYLSGLVARATGLPEADATQRVNDVLTQARETAESARKAGIVAAFFAAATMLMGLAVAWFAAKKGGEDRDKDSLRLHR